MKRPSHSRHRCQLTRDSSRVGGTDANMFAFRNECRESMRRVSTSGPKMRNSVCFFFLWFFFSLSFLSFFLSFFPSFPFSIFAFSSCYLFLPCQVIERSRKIIAFDPFLLGQLRAAFPSIPDLSEKGVIIPQAVSLYVKFIGRSLVDCSSLCLSISLFFY